jgi:vancomycin resistance protein YoaR
MKKKHILMIFTLLIIAAVFYVGFKTFKAVSPDRIAANVTAHGVKLSGMTEKEAENALLARYQTAAGAQTVRFIDGEMEASVCTFADLGFRFNFAAVIDEAMKVGRGGVWQRIQIAMPWAKPVTVNALAAYTVDEEKIKDKLQSLAAEKDFKPVNATFMFENGDFTVKPGADGRAVDIERTAAAVYEVIKQMRNGDVRLVYRTLPPAHPTDEFTFEVSLLGKYETHFAGGTDEPRRNNIKIAASRINNKVLFPGEIFSAGEAVGSGTPDNGYSRAVVLVNGKPTEDWGGGVCQVVTTLYNAALRAELDIPERHNHSAKVSYVDYSFDATVAGDYFDLKIKNNTSKPVLLAAEVGDGTLTVSVYGYEAREPNRRVEFVNKLIETTPPEPEAVSYDPSVPFGEIWVTTVAQDGYKYELYKNIYIDGALKETVKINSSSYKPVRGTVLQRP